MWYIKYSEIKRIHSQIDREKYLLVRIITTLPRKNGVYFLCRYKSDTSVFIAKAALSRQVLGV